MELKLDPISLIFLAYNEASTVEKEILSFYEKIIKKIPESEFIVAEDGSTDGTSEIIKRLAKEIGIIHLTSKQRKGYTKALIDAVSYAKKDLIFFSDTGLKHDPKDFWKMYDFRNDYDLIIGKKSDRNDQFYRKFFTLGYNFIIRFYFDSQDIFDCDSGFRLFNRRVVEQIYKGGKLFFKELPNSEVVIRAKFYRFKYKEINVSYFQRKGESRGLPLKKIPKVIIKTLANLRKLKKELACEVSLLGYP